jgi:hypothetical protein
MLTLLDCRNGVTLSLVVDGKILKLHTATPSNIRFTSFNPAVCGSMPGAGFPVTIVYRSSNAAGIVGEPLIVQFQQN